MTFHRNRLLALIALVALLVAPGFTRSPAGDGSGPGAVLLAQLTEYETGCAIVTEAQITAAIDDGRHWYYIGDLSDEIDEQGRIQDEDYFEEYGAAYVCTFEPADSLIKQLTFIYIVNGEELFPDLLEYSIDSAGPGMTASYRTPDRLHYQFLVEGEGMFREALLLCTGGAVVQLSYSTSESEAMDANDDLDYLGHLFCTL
ncbi:MAG: hypothetical protein KF813_00950 [Trueperaceae bacterium]|nr:hypothetical protein [Trueperaceae bacterium]